MILEGKPVADRIKAWVKEEIARLGLSPSLAILLVGDNPASEVYVNNKAAHCKEVGVVPLVHKFPADYPVDQLRQRINSLTEQDGILVQLPLPSAYDEYELLNLVPADKDVDCFCAANIGKLAYGKAVMKPCTPLAVIEMLKHYGIGTERKRVTIINRSKVVGQPLATMLTQPPYNATVTVCHEFTPTSSVLVDHTLSSDIVVTAVGTYPKFRLLAEWVRPTATVIDVAINRGADNKIFGDTVDYKSFRAKNITKVPGGIGPITIANLLRNTVLAAKLRRNYEVDV